MLKNALFVVLLLSSLMSALFIEPALAVIEEYAFEQEEQEDRFKRLIAEMRCPMCLNSNLAGSDAPIAANLRAEIYDQIVAGQSDDEIMGFMKVRYGDFISYRPPLNKSTFLLWFGPGLLLILGFIIALRMIKSSQATVADESLNAKENQRLAELLKLEANFEAESDINNASEVKNSKKHKKSGKNKK